MSSSIRTGSMLSQLLTMVNSCLRSNTGMAWARLAMRFLGSVSSSLSGADSSVKNYTESCLLAHAKPLKNPPQNLVGGNLARDCADVVEGFAEVLGNQVGREGGVQGGADTVKGG